MASTIKSSLLLWSSVLSILAQSIGVSVKATIPESAMANTTVIP